MGKETGKDMTDKYHNAASYIVNMAFLYFVLDFAVRGTNITEYGSVIGIKNFLPTAAGLILGAYGTIGCMIGSLIVSLIFHTTAGEIIFEMCAIAIAGMGMWLLWHFNKNVGCVFLKKPIDYVRYIAILGVCSVCISILSGIFNIGCSSWAIFGCYFAAGIFVGIPIIILCTSIICVSPVIPPWCMQAESVSVSSDTALSGLSEINEGIEEFAGEHGISIKQVFGIENCIEEVLLRIDGKLPQTAVDVTVNFHDSVSIRLSYKGARYNPLKVERGEGEEELLGAKLITHRALRASYSYHHGINDIHIVA